MNKDQFIEQLKRHEGFRDKIYLDNVGIATIGWGHALIPGSAMSVEICEKLLDQDIANVERDFEAFDFGLDPNDTVRKYALMNMIFNLGMVRFSGFRKFIAAIKEKAWMKASLEAIDSKWARQVGNRAVELSEMIRTGKYKGA